MLTCTGCGNDTADEPISWPDGKGGVLCQNCWEHDCDREFWRVMGAEPGPGEDWNAEKPPPMTDLEEK